ncbi:MgtC/SapB family protein [Pelagibacterium limicola]|uniref:MgtC/SapB family protein n=1 Tax=Pelagibacterium limicola TaxID=2791022 RepID=UPI0018AFE1D6|nr:MgtC/SapB family protein [Pelagibacterium limicola]
MPPFDIIGANATQLPLSAIVVRLAIAGLLGAIIGFEREIKNRPAGLRTHMLTAIAAAAFTIMTYEIYYEMVELDLGLAQLDPLRVIEAVTAGVAFLAAGAIIRSGTNITGLTTGAAMWMAGAIGVACGSGFYAVAVVGAVFVLTVTIILGYFEKKVLHSKVGQLGGDEGTPG